ncbi:MAG: PilZ domain-containing protein [Candidatus Omnitrophica bacterium]|nr:PilZ domain-containing protein [Candidatus Omnitrophota bacterium]
MIDKRELRRIEVDLKAECKCIEPVEKKLKVRVVNINQNGLCCVVPMQLKFGQTASLDVDLQTQGRLCADVAVVWSEHIGKTEEHHVGFKITEIAPEQEAKFFHFYNCQLMRQRFGV